MPTYSGLPYFTVDDAPDGAGQQAALAAAAAAQFAADEATQIAAYVHAVNTAATSIPTSTSTTVPWTTVAPTTDNAHNTGTWNAGVRTIAYDGIYVVRARVSYDLVTAPAGSRQITLYVAGNLVDADNQRADSSLITRLNTQYIGPIKAGQSVTVFTYQNQGSTQKLANDVGACSFMLARLSAL